MPPRLLQYSDVENVCDDPDRTGRFVRTIERCRDEETIVVGTGDNTAPGVLPLVSEGRQAIPFYKAFEPDIETFGNHDFDFGPETTLEIVAETPQTWVSANVRQNGSRFGEEEGVEPWTVLERDGVRIGFTGVTTPRTASLNPMATDVTFRAPIPAAREAIDDLREFGVDVVVVCSHLGSADDELARSVDADVILGGHVPSTRIDRISGTLLTRPGDGGTSIVEVTLEGEPSARLRSVVDTDPKPAVVDEFERLNAAVGLDEVVGRVEEPMMRTESTLFGGESRVGNFVADAYRWQTGADIALQNSGGVRSGSPLSGTVTAADVIGLVPFDERLAIAELPGERLEAVFDDAVGVDLGFAEEGWWHAQVSGVELEWHADDTVELRAVGGERFDPDEEYRLVASDYLFHTDDEFPALRADDRIEWSTATQYDILVDYARACGVETHIGERVRRVN